MRFSKLTLLRLRLILLSRPRQLGEKFIDISILGISILELECRANGQKGPEALVGRFRPSRSGPAAWVGVGA